MLELNVVGYHRFIPLSIDSNRKKYWPVILPDHKDQTVNLREYFLDFVYTINGSFVYLPHSSEENETNLKRWLKKIKAKSANVRQVVAWDSQSRWERLELDELWSSVIITRTAAMFLLLQEVLCLIGPWKWCKKWLNIFNNSASSEHIWTFIMTIKWQKYKKCCVSRTILSIIKLNTCKCCFCVYFPLTKL